MASKKELEERVHELSGVCDVFCAFIHNVFDEAGIEPDVDDFDPIREARRVASVLRGAK